jgi:predicted phosphoribosyltransferase
MSRFDDRREAGRILARQLSNYAGRSDVLVLALPRGGVPVGYEVAKLLGAPLDVFTVRKIGLPWNEELAIGAVASGDVRLLDRHAIARFGISDATLQRTIARERRELARRERLYRDERPFPNLAGKTVILVDDGLATGASARTAVEAVRTYHPARVVVAVPVASREACAMLASVADACVCVEKPEPFYAVGTWYYDFSQTTDEEVIALLRAAAERLPKPVAA